MRRRLAIARIVFTAVAVSCGGTADSDGDLARELTRRFQVPRPSVFDAIGDAVDRLGGDSVGAFLLDKAEVTTDVDPRDLAVEDLADDECAARRAITDAFTPSGALWSGYLDTPAGAKACRIAYAPFNG